MGAKVGQNSIIGSGGGGLGKGGGKGGPSEAPNTLRSKATIATLWKLAEGEIDDLTVTEFEQRLFFDRVPLSQPDNTRNFQNVEWAFATGTQDQGLLKGFGNTIEAETAVNQTIRKAVAPVIRFVNNTNFDFVRIRLQFPGLLETDGQDIVGSSVEFTISIQDSQGTYITQDGSSTAGATRFVVEGKTQNYERTYVFTLSGVGPWRIRIERLTDDSVGTTTRNDLVWASYTGIIADRYRYPNSALLGVQVDSEEFDGIPSIGVLLRGLKLKYPHNYNPLTRSYSGFFNGSFSGYGYTNNPAWVLYGLVTNSRYGAGEKTPVDIIDPYTLYEVGQYCDELVSDGQGGQEPRFTCNAYLTSAQDAPVVIEQLVALFRGLLYYAGGQILFTQDKASDRTRRIYTKANTIEDRDESGRIIAPCFRYEGSSERARHTAALVSFRDKDNFYAQDQEYVSDESAIARYGYNPLQLNAFGTTSRAQAHRVGLYALLSEQNEREVVRFRIGTEGYLCKPTEIIAVADPHRLGNDRGGRIASATLSTVTLDRPVNLLSDRIYSITVLQSEITATVNLSQSETAPHIVTGSDFDELLIGATLGAAKVSVVHDSSTIQLDSNPGLGTSVSFAATFYPQNTSIERVITNAAGTHTTLNLLAPLLGVPPTHSTWILSDDVQPVEEYRVLQITPRYAEARINEWEIIAIRHDVTKFAAIDAFERGASFRKIQPPRPNPPQNVSSQYDYQKNLLSISWEPPVRTSGNINAMAMGLPSDAVTGTASVRAYRPQYREVNGNWISLSLTQDTRTEVFLPDANYEVRVQAISITGNLSRLGARVADSSISSPLRYPYSAALMVAI